MFLLITSASSGQVKFPEYLEHYDDTKALVDQEQVRGHHWSVIDKTARNAIPEDKREIGMLVTWIESSTYVTKRFQGANTTNTVWTNDLNWRSLIISTDTITYANIAFSAAEADTSDFVRNLTNVDSISLSGINGGITHSEGALKYDSVTHSLQFQNDIIGFSHNLGYEVVSRVYNNTGVKIDNGKLVTVAGVYIDGDLRTPTVKLAQTDSITNLNPIAMATADIDPESYGVATLLGEVKGLNTSGYPNGSPLWADVNGGVRSTPPAPPAYALEIGFGLYADATNGSVYMQPQNVTLDPTPHFAADSSGILYTVPVSAANVYYKIPFAQTKIRDSEGFIIQGDSVQVLTGGHYDLNFGMSFNGNPTSETWQYGIFINGSPAYTKIRSTSSNATGDVNVKCYRVLKKNEWLSYRIRNTTGLGDPEILSISIGSALFHE